MNTNILSFEPCEASAHTEDYIFYKIEKGDPSLIPGFLSAWCRYVCVRPLLIPGLLCVSNQLDLFQTSMVFSIYGWDTVKGWGKRKNRRDFATSLYHEMCHIMLYVIGYPEHNEEKIEACAKRLARKNDGIIEVMADLYPGFSGNEKNGIFYHRDLAPQYISDVPYKKS